MVASRLPPHLRLFFTFAGAGAALISTLTLWAASLQAGLVTSQIDPLKLVVVAVVTGALFYSFDQLLSTRTMSYMLGRAMLMWLRVAMIVLLAYVVLPEHNRGLMREAMQFWAITTPLVLLPTLALMRMTAAHLYGGTEYRRSALFVMPGHLARTLALRLQRSPTLGIDVQGYFGAASELEEADPTLARLGDIEDVVEHLRRHPCKVAFLSMTVMQTPHAKAILDQLGDTTSAIYCVPESPILENFQVHVGDMAGVPLLMLHDTQIQGLARSLKRGMDLVISSLMLLVFALPMAIIAAAVKIGSPGPVLFRQTRYGLDGKPIQVMKFRSMYVNQPDAAAVKQATRDDPRITRLGAILRRTSLDELPQIFNVFNGSMSLVGPRPHAAAHNEFYRQQIKGYMLRHTVKPGITGWAQVNGLRGETDTLDKMMMRVEFDRYYIQNWTPLLDLQIILRTALLVIRDDKAY